MITPSLPRIGAAFVLVAMPISLTFSACSGIATSLCDDACDCIGCSENEHAECVDHTEDLAKVSEEEGCTDQYDEYTSCVSEQLQCRDGEIDADGCDNEKDRFDACMRHTSIGGGTPCEIWKAEFEDCCQRLDGSQQEACFKAVNSLDFDDQDRCEAQSDSFDCPV